MLAALEGPLDLELCALFGVPVECLPRITPSTGELGGIGAGGASVALSASLVDQQAATYGHGCRRAGDAKITFGTGAFAFVIVGAELPPHRHGCLPTVAWARGLGLFGDLSELEDFGSEPAIMRGLSFMPALAGLAAARVVVEDCGTQSGQR